MALIARMAWQAWGWRSHVRNIWSDASRVTRNAIHMPYVWSAVGILYLTDAIWSWTIGLTLSSYTAFLVMICILLLATVLLRGKQRNPRLAVAMEVWALWTAFANAANLLTYLAATPALPPRDDLLAGLDRDLGFNWMAFYDIVQVHPFVSRLLSICYGSLLPETLVLAVFLSFARLERRLSEFFWVIYIAILLTSILSSVAPAEGAFAHYGLPGRADHLHDLNTLRGGSNLHFALPNMVGLVTFPSFHAVVPLLVIYITRGTGLTGWLFTVWNLIMLISIVPMGGHYLVDVTGGAGVLIIAILARRSAARFWSWSFERRASGRHASVSSKSLVLPGIPIEGTWPISPVPGHDRCRISATARSSLEIRGSVPH